MESPFYEKAGRYLHAGISENMTFPVHLQEEMEIIYCLEGSLQATVMNQVREVEEGECVLIFPGQIHGYHTKEHSRVLMLIFSPAAAGVYGRTLQKMCPETPFVKAEEIPEDTRIALERLCAPQVRADGKGIIHIAILIVKITPTKIRRFLVFAIKGQQAQQTYMQHSPIV